VTCLFRIAMLVLFSLGNIAVALQKSLPSSLTFPVLSILGGFFNFNNNPHLTFLSFPALTSIGGDGSYAFLAYNNTLLQTIYLPTLHTLGSGDVWICGNLNNTCIVPASLSKAWGSSNSCSLNTNPTNVTCPDIWSPCPHGFTCPQEA
jgi:hypothetical protein